ncbi:hypothetical protein FRC12_004818 [Ceratobasidium sp. 428]|nr:hypothetical protein FRC12_004818 [Ceratobasidium sp. 428]
MEERPRRGVHHAVESLRRRFRAYTHKDIPPPMTAPYPRAFVPNLSSLNGSQAVPDTFSTNLLPSQADSGTKSSWLLSNRPALVTPTNDARAIKQSSWTGLTAFIVVLNQATAAFDPLKSAVRNLINHVGFLEASRELVTVATKNYRHGSRNRPLLKKTIGNYETK